MAYEEKGLNCERQYGFKKGSGTEDALVSLKRAIGGTEKKYVVAVFVDIEGAFDNLWWPTILDRVIAVNCSTKLFKIVSNYFKSRKACISTKMGKTQTSMQKGCPQGSIIGPAAWVWCMDMLLLKIGSKILEE